MFLFYDWPFLRGNCKYIFHFNSWVTFQRHCRLLRECMGPFILSADDIIMHFIKVILSFQFIPTNLLFALNNCSTLKFSNLFESFLCSLSFSSGYIGLRVVNIQYIVHACLLRCKTVPASKYYIEK